MVTITNRVERNAAHVRCIASLMGVFIVIYLWLASVSKLSSKGSEGEGCGGWHDSVSEEAEFVSSIVTGDAQLGIVHPTGRPIKVSTQRGLSLPVAFASTSTFSCLHWTMVASLWPLLWSFACGVAHAI